MAARHFLLATTLCLPLGAPLIPLASAQEVQLQPDVENAKYHFAGRTNAANVQVRSGPGDNYYPTARLDKDAQVTVVGIRFEWLKIKPPEGSFSVVAKAFVKKKDGAANVGVVDAESLNVRAGSTLSPLKITVQCKLKKGDEVVILGEQDEYYKIQPPSEAYLYVHQNFVSPVKQVAGPDTPKKIEIVRNDTERRTETTPPATRLSDTDTVENPPVAVKPEPVAPATQPAVAKGPAPEEVFDELETQYRKAGELPLEQQPVAELITGYEKLLRAENLAPTMRQMAEIRAGVLKVRARNKDDLLATLRATEQGNARLAEIKEQRRQLEAKALNISVYTACGTLQASTLQAGQGTLYRLVDNTSGRTLCYVRSEDPKCATLVGQFVGAKGELVTDAQLTLKTVNALSVEIVDPQAVGKTVSAQIMPPSLVQNAGAAKNRGSEQANTKD